MSNENVPKAMLEVWEMKRLANKELENIPEDKQVSYIHQKVKGVWESVLKKRAENKQTQQNT